MGCVEVVPHLYMSFLNCLLTYLTSCFFHESSRDTYLPPITGNTQNCSIPHIPYHTVYLYSQHLKDRTTTSRSVYTYISSLVPGYWPQLAHCPSWSLHNLSKLSVMEKIPPPYIYLPCLKSYLNLIFAMTV